MATRKQAAVDVEDVPVKGAKGSKGGALAVVKGGAVANPAEIEARLAALAEKATEQEASVSTGSFISFKAGQMAYQGTPVADNALDCVVVDACLENVYYEGDYDPDNKQPPACYAFGRDDKELRPHPEAKEPQSETCRDCQWNKFGSAERGDGKACKNIRRLALIPADHADTAANVAKAELAFAKIPVTSVKAWAAYVRTLKALENKPPQGVVTKISVHPDQKTQFRVSFSHEENLKPAVIAAVLDKMDSCEEQLMAPYPEATEEEAPRGRSKPAAKKAGNGKRRY